MPVNANKYCIVWWNKRKYFKFTFTFELIFNNACSSTQVNGLWAQGRTTCWTRGEHRMEPAYSRLGQKHRCMFWKQPLIPPAWHGVRNWRSLLVFKVFLSLSVSSLKSRPRCWAAIYPWMTSTLSPDRGTRRPPCTRSSIKNAENEEKDISPFSQGRCLPGDCHT